jgi:hypothetical protein
MDNFRLEKQDKTTGSVTQRAQNEQEPPTSDVFVGLNFSLNAQVFVM